MLVSHVSTGHGYSTDPTAVSLRKSLSAPAIGRRAAHTGEVQGAAVLDENALRTLYPSLYAEKPAPQGAHRRLTTLVLANALFLVFPVLIGVALHIGH